MKIGIAVVGGAVAVGVAFWAGTTTVDSPKEPAAHQSTTTTSASSAGLVEFRDEKAGWAISYPNGWNRLQPTDTGVALVVSEKPAEQNSGGSILARDLTLGAPVN